MAPNDAAFFAVDTKFLISESSRLGTAVGFYGNKATVLCRRVELRQPLGNWALTGHTAMVSVPYQRFIG